MADTSSDWRVLAREWEEAFGTPMPYGFEIGPRQLPLLRRCIRERSQAPLAEYIAALPPDTDY